MSDVFMEESGENLKRKNILRFLGKQDKKELRRTALPARLQRSPAGGYWFTLHISVNDADDDTG